eukprot:TRINITY_DN1533_c0_g1_i1.p1 TRINITY_DN1533_c0_g1~~TRINITY_DN1533_c0_g1_i1.p1  ORF type:complete len:160 (+),score=64.54 TRINITY_DN1533_c0_g1_i1:169-648(+)
MKQRIFLAVLAALSFFTAYLLAGYKDAELYDKLKTVMGDVSTAKRQAEELGRETKRLNQEAVDLKAQGNTRAMEYMQCENSKAGALDRSNRENEGVLRLKREAEGRQRDVDRIKAEIEASKKEAQDCKAKQSEKDTAYRDLEEERSAVQAELKALRASK